MKIVINNVKIPVPSTIAFIFIKKNMGSNLDRKSKKIIIKELKKFAKTNKGFELITIEDDVNVKIIL